MGYYLLDHKNPHAAGGFHGYPSRRATVRLLAIHTTESAFDLIGPDDGAEDVAGYLSRTDRQASYHDIADSDSLVPCLPWSYTAFGARGFNTPVIHMAFAGEAANWHTLSDTQVDARLTMLAGRARAACAAYDIPIRRLIGSTARTPGASGICGHADLDPDRRTDPGDGFPWARFIRLLQEDDIMASIDDLRTAIREEAGAAVWGHPLRDRATAQGTLTAARQLEDTRRWTLMAMKLSASGDVDVEALAADLAERLGQAQGQRLADELARRLAE